MTITIVADVDEAISENGGSTMGRVYRSDADTSRVLVVDLASDDESEATVPEQVEIAAGRTAATFLVTAADAGFEKDDCFAYDYPIKVPALTFLSQLI